MKNLKILTAAVFAASSSLLFSGNVLADLDTNDATISAGSACEAYSAGQATRLQADWSTLKAKAKTWVHCPGSGLGTGTKADNAVFFNMEIPVDALTDVWNCYVAAQQPTSGSATKKVIWKAGSDAGIAQAELVLNSDFPGDATASITSGCQLGAKHMLHSVEVKAKTP